MTLRPLRPDLATRLARVQAAGAMAVAVLDVDLTLIDNAPRNRAIWGAWLHEQRGRWPGAAAAALAAQTMPIVFGVRDNLATLGVTDPALVAEGLAFWRRHFFASDGCRFDAALPGAVEAVEALVGAGVAVIYLTARPLAMAEGTVASLQRLGFPVAQVGAQLVMKDDPREEDGAFKVRALAWFGGVGRPILVADNEPGHVNAMHAAFPDALAVHVATRHSAGAPPLAEGVVTRRQLAEAVIAAEG